MDPDQSWRAGSGRPQRAVSQPAVAQTKSNGQLFVVALTGALVGVMTQRVDLVLERLEQRLILLSLAPAFFA